jgi:collagenase-like PrtC family protease
MTGGDLIVLAPWVVFGACLIAISIRLFTRRHASRRHSAPGREHGKR